MATPVAHDYAEQTYLPLPEQERSGIALCLSGGGFRAALFHLGALRRLNEWGILQEVKTITAVSGGSMIAAHLVRTLDKWRSAPLPVCEWDEHVAAPFRAFASRNLSAAPVALGWLLFATDAGLRFLARRCEERLTLLKLRDLPETPRFMFCTVDLVTGRPYVLDRNHEGTWSVGKAAAASSCFPGYFRPLRQTTPHWRALVDGGVGDNRGVEPVWKDHSAVIVSDGGDVLRPTWSRSLFWLARSAYVVWNQGQEIRKRWLLSSFLAGKMKGVYWGISSSASHYGSQSSLFPGYSAALARDVIARVRTDYDAFSDAEAAVLENHGYLLADAGIRTHVASLSSPPPLHVPHPAWLCEQKVAQALKDSSKKKLFGRH
jgi:NTE family protein